MKSSPLKKPLLPFLVFNLFSFVSLAQKVANDASKCEHAKPMNVVRVKDTARNNLMIRYSPLDSCTIGSHDTDKFQVTHQMIPRDTIECDLRASVIDRKTRKPIPGVQIIVHEKGFEYGNKFERTEELQSRNDGSFFTIAGTDCCFSIILSAKGYKCLEVKNIFDPGRVLIFKMDRK